MKKYEYIVLLLVVVALIYNYQQNKTTPKLPVVKPVVVNPIEPVVPDDDNGCDRQLQKALQTDKRLIIIFSAKWCGFCRTLKKDLDSLDISQYEVCNIDVDDKDQAELASHFGIKIVPTSIMVDPATNKEIKRITGYVAENYKRWLKE
jgi:thioredoxin-related protein